jgi:hypothetical protein
MTAAAVETRRSLRGKFWAAVALAFLVQVALLCWFSDRTPTEPRLPAVAPVFRLDSAAAGERRALEDPTLFVLPHQQSFSGAAWMKIPPLEFRSESWSEDPRWLALPDEQLGAEFAGFMQTNFTDSFPNIVMLEPVLTFPELPPTEPISTPSRLRLEGALTRRRLLSIPALTNWAYADLLTNSVVQLLVDARGNTFSAVLLPPGCGFKEADSCALQIARTARFESIEPTGPDRATRPKPGLTLGTMIFEWQTLPATNSLAVAP